jgi:hypothetical protein
MSKGDLYSYWHRMLDRFMDQNNVPVVDKPYFKKLIIAGLKAEQGVESLSKLSHYDRWFFIQQAEITLITEYGYMVEDDMKLKFKD